MFIAHNEKTSRSVRSGMWLRFVSYKHVVPTGRFARAISLGQATVQRVYRHRDGLRGNQPGISDRTASLWIPRWFAVGAF
jgi:hypothetical protein